MNKYIVSNGHYTDKHMKHLRKEKEFGQRSEVVSFDWYFLIPAQDH